MTGQLEEALGQIVRIGTVMSVDADNCLARVKFQDVDMTSGWLYVLQRWGTALDIKEDGEHTHVIHDTFTDGGTAENSEKHNHPKSITTFWMPRVNDTVACLYLPTFNADGLILGAVMKQKEGGHS